jgi:hypothetical protein
VKEAIMSYNKDWFYGRGVEDEEARAERHELRKVIGILLVVGVLVGLFLGVAGCADAQSERSLVFRALHRDGSPVVFRAFTAKPCTDARILGFLKHKFGAPAELLPHFKASILTWQGKDWASCWIEQQGYVVSVDEEGSSFQPVRMSRMKDEAL